MKWNGMASRDVYGIVEQVFEDAVYWITYIRGDDCGLFELRDVSLGEAMDMYSKIPTEATEDWTDEDWMRAEDYWHELVETMIRWDKLEEECLEE